MQSDKTHILNRILEETSAKYGENSIQATKVREDVLKSVAAEERYKKKLEEVNTIIQTQNTRLETLKGKLKTASESLSGFGKKLETFGKNAEQWGSRYSMFVTTPIVAGFGLASKAAIDFEKEFVKVTKTVDATPEQYAEISDAIRKNGNGNTN